MIIDEKLKEIVRICKNEEGNKRDVEVYSILVEIKNKGKCEGHIKAVEICKNALEDIENSNSGSY